MEMLFAAIYHQRLLGHANQPSLDPMIHTEFTDTYDVISYIGIFYCSGLVLHFLSKSYISFMNQLCLRRFLWNSLEEIQNEAIVEIHSNYRAINECG